MNFIEALAALSEGRCKGIRRNNWIHAPDIVMMDGFISSNVVYTEGLLATDWELVDETPQFEEVEVVRWGVYYKSDNELVATFDTEEEALRILVHTSAYVVRLTGTYKRPLPKKVKRKVKAGKIPQFGELHDIPHDAIFYAEWTEEEVRG